MSATFGTVTIVGVGLLGGSLGLALKQRGLADMVRGVARRSEMLDVARDIRAIDEGFLDLGASLPGADLVVLCTPAAQVPQQLDVVRTRIGLKVTVTDVASTKARICSHMRGNWAEPYRFVGSHPMAGSEKSGPEHATANLYEGSVTVVEPLDGHAEDAHATVRRLWQSVGATVVEIAPDEHDAIVAKTSHLPHIAAALIAELAHSEPRARELVGKGFRDVTRVAAGRAEIWRDICLTNGPAIIEALKLFCNRAEEVRQWIERGDGAALEAFFRDAAQARARLVGQ